MREIHAGDYAHHEPSGEEWVVLGVDAKGDRLCAMGWPNSIARLSDCRLTERGHGLTDDEVAARQQVYGGGWDA